MQKRYGSSIGLLDIFLLLMILGSLIVITGSRTSSSFVTSSYAWLVLSSIAFAWRRGWIQRFLDAQKEQKRLQEEREAARLLQEKQLQAPTEPAYEPLNPNDIELPKFRIQSPRMEKLSPAQATSLIRVLMEKAKSGFLELSLIGSREGVQWEVTYFGSNENSLTPEGLTELFNTYYPGSVASRTPLSEPEKALYRRYHILKPQATRYFDRALEVSAIGKDDPLGHLAQALVELEAGETLTYTVFVVLVSTADEEELERVLTISAHEAGYRYQPGGIQTHNVEAAVGSAFGAFITTTIRNQGLKKQRVQLYSDAETARFLEKLTQPLALCSISLTFDSQSPERLKSIERVYGAVQGLSGEEIRIQQGYTSSDIPIRNFDDWFTKTAVDYVRDLASGGETTSQLFSSFLFNLTAEELAALWHLPHAGFPAGALGYKGVHAPIPRGLKMGEGGVRIGVNQVGLHKTDVYLPPNDRTSHTVVIGKTGFGKSSLVHNMVHQDIAVGRGVCVIDPKGDLIADILQHSIPASREEDVIILDVSNRVDGKFVPPPFNVFVSGLDRDETETAAQRLVSLFTLTQKDFAEKKMAATLKMALMAVYYIPQPTLHDVHCLLFDANYRARLIPHIRNGMVANFWQKFDLKKESAQTSLTEPLEWRLERFMLNERLRAMTCHPKPLDVGKLLGENKIILVSLGDDKDLIDQEERYFLGAAFLAQLDYAARSRVIRKPPFMVYIDEAQEFVGTSLPRMLSQLRSYGMGLVLANQYFGQILGDTFKAVEGNVSTLISFETGDSDAGTLASYLQPALTKADLTHLGKYTAAVSMLDAEGQRQAAFTVKTVPPPGFETKRSDREAELRRRSMERWGLPSYDDVLKVIDERYGQCHGNFPASATGEPAGTDDEFYG